MWCVGVACKDNGKVDGCRSSSIAGDNSYKVIVGVWSFGVGWRRGREKRKGENSHAGFTQIKTAHF